MKLDIPLGVHRVVPEVLDWLSEKKGHEQGGDLLSSLFPIDSSASELPYRHKADQRGITLTQLIVGRETYAFGLH